MALSNIPFFYESASWNDKNALKFGKWKSVEHRKGAIGEQQGYGPTMKAFSSGFALASDGECERARTVYADEFVPGFENETVRSIAIMDVQSAGPLLDVARSFLKARIAEKCDDDLEGAVSWWKEAVRSYDSIIYMEPPFWPLSPRCCLGQLYLDRNEFEMAEKEFEIDLVYSPKNGWALRGMIDALRGRRNKNQKALQKYEKRFEKAWKHADVDIDRACY